MPNDCNNWITVTCNDETTFNKFIENELFDIEKYNSEHHEVIKILKKGKLGIVFKLWSPWVPNFDWLETTLNNYPGIWIKNEWREEGGMAGVWIGYMKNNEPYITPTKKKNETKLY